MKLPVPDTDKLPETVAFAPEIVKAKVSNAVVLVVKNCIAVPAVLCPIAAPVVDLNINLSFCKIVLFVPTVIKPPTSKSVVTVKSFPIVTSSGKPIVNV